METRSPRIGTVISGTHRSEDLLRAFLEEFMELVHGTKLSKDDQQLIKDAKTVSAPIIPDDNTFGAVEIDDIVAELSDRLNDLAPPFCYFGTAPGDGADFGFWVDQELIMMTIRDHEMCCEQCNGMRSHWSGPPEAESYQKVFVNDHGNITLYERDHLTADWREIWALV